MLSISTDCSGLESPIEALKQLKIKYKHVWSCDYDKYVKEMILENYNPELFFDDVFKRNVKNLPNIDLYICGFPCQSYSSIGKMQGSKDPRSNVMKECLKVIRIKKPKVFILENVKNFQSVENGKMFNYLLKNIDSKIYNVYYKLLNTKDYGIPQNRKRIYFIGIKKSIQNAEFQFPKVKQMKPIDTIFKDRKIYNVPISKSLDKNLKIINYEKGYLVTPFTFATIIKGYSPTLTTNCSQIYSTTYKRYLTIPECLRLQGFKTKLNQVVSNTQFYKQIGNSMSINVLKELFKEIFKVAKFN